MERLQAELALEPGQRRRGRNQGHIDAEFKDNSLRNVENGTWGAPFGGEGRGKQAA